MKKSTKRNIAVTALLIAGLSVLFYPFVSNRINQYKADKIINNYISETKNRNSSENKKELEYARRYNESLVGQTPPDTFSEREGIHHDKVYDNLLNNSSDGVMACLDIPSIEVRIPVFHYSTKEVLEKGAGHLFGSSLPIGGNNTHSVITAHRGLPSAKMFTDLDLMKKNDLIYIYVSGKNLAYAVDKIKTVKPEDCSDLGIEEGKDQITLVTCTPYGKNTERLLVRGHRTKYPGKGTHVHNRISLNHILFGLAGALVALISFVLYRLIKREYGRK